VVRQAQHDGVARAIEDVPAAVAEEMWSPAYPEYVSS
jgi:hypothetical protein